VLDWLLDDRAGNRQTGRSTVYAIALIRAALRQPRFPVEITPITYVENRSVKEILVRSIKRFIDDDPQLQGRVVYDDRRDYLQSLLSHPVVDWLPVLPDVPEHVLERIKELPALVRPKPKAPPKPTEPEKPAPSVWERLIGSVL
jgi:hypothetical protein